MPSPVVPRKKTAKAATWPAAGPKPRATPYPLGTLVNGATPTGIVGLPDCRNHGGVFILTTKPHKADISNSGYKQGVRCMVCGQTYQHIDCEFLKIKVTKEQVQDCIRRMTKARNHLLLARRELQGLLEQM